MSHSQVWQSVAIQMEMVRKLLDHEELVMKPVMICIEASSFGVVWSQFLCDLVIWIVQAQLKLTLRHLKEAPIGRYTGYDDGSQLCGRFFLTNISFHGLKASRFPLDVPGNWDNLRSI